MTVEIYPQLHRRLLRYSLYLDFTKLRSVAHNLLESEEYIYTSFVMKTQALLRGTL